MDEQFASIPLSNATRLCVGSITEREAANLRADGIEEDGFGLYLFLAKDSEPSAPIEILGKIFSPEVGHRLFRLMPA
jgi:hypothetical protein